MKIKDLPESVPFFLEEEDGIKYPVKGDFETSYELTLLCFSKKTFAQTWPLRQRLMQAFTSLTGSLGQVAEDADKPEEEKQDDSKMDGEDLMNACMIGNFDAQLALEEFKQAIVANNLIKLDDENFLNKHRWAQIDEMTQEQIMFEYMANFIQPCVLTEKVKK